MRLREWTIGLLRKSERLFRTDMMYVASGGFWLLVGKVSILVSSLAVAVAFAHLVPKETYGTYQYIISMVAALSIFALPGMDNALIRTVARGENRTFFPATRSKVKSSLIGSTAIIAISIWYLANSNLVLGGAFLIAALFFPIVSPLSTSQSFWQGRKQFRRQNTYITIFNLGHAVALVSTLFLTDKLLIIIGAYFIPRAIMQVAFYIFTRRFAKGGEIDEKTIPYGKKLSVIQGIRIVSNYIDKVILWYFLGPVEVAVYSLAQMPMQRLKRFLPITELALPKLSERSINKNRKKGLLRKFVFVLIATLLLIGLLILILPTIYRLFLSPYVDSIPYAQVLTLMLLVAPFLLLRTSLVAEGMVRELYTIEAIVPALQILLFIILIHFYGMWGAVAAIITSTLFEGALTLYFFISKKSTDNSN